MSNPEIIQSLSKAKEVISIVEFSKEKIEKELLEEANKLTNRGNLLWPLRAALSGKKNSAGPIDLILTLGREKTITRIDEAINKLKQNV
jgi:glutamyl/glutaminyl-tRNA synthetase